jgi:serine protease Do
MARSFLFLFFKKEALTRRTTRKESASFLKKRSKKLLQIWFRSVLVMDFPGSGWVCDDPVKVVPGFQQMRRLLFAALVVLGCPSLARAGEPNAALADVVQSVLPAVVNITIWQLHPDNNSGTTDAAAARPRQLFGSGFVIDATGVIVTNRHVLDGADEITVGFSDGTRTLAQPLAIASGIDVALLKVHVDHPLPILRFGNSDDLRIGDPVMTVGNPLGIGTSVSAGIVSALNRDIKDTPYDDFIQTDAAINHGNSGGPLVNTAGEVVGIDTALYSDVANGGSIGLGFAIPSNDARFVVGRLREYGNVMAGWIGASVQDMTADLAAAMGMDAPHGAIISSIDAGGPASAADLRAGDVLLKIGDETPADGRGFMRAAARIQVGETVPVTFMRLGVQRTVMVTIAEWPGDMVKPTMPGDAMQTPHAHPPDMGLTLGPITADARTRYNLPQDLQGVLISAVDRDSPASIHGLLPGDVILKVQDVDVSSPADVARVVAQARAANRSFIAALVRKKDGEEWVGMRTNPLP